jgi:hypothetical protein
MCGLTMKVVGPHCFLAVECMLYAILMLLISQHIQNIINFCLRFIKIVYTFAVKTFV